MAAHGPSDAAPGNLLDLLGKHKLATPFRGGIHDGRGQHVRRRLVQGAGHGQDLVCGQRTRGHNGGQCRMTRGQGSGLVEEESPAAREPLEDAAALHDDATSRREGEPRDDRNRGTQNQGARSRHDEDRNRTPCSSGGPRRSGHHESEEQEPEGIAIGQPDEGRRHGLGLGHQADDPGVGAVGSVGGSAQVEWPARIHDPAPHGIARPALDG